MSLMGCLQRKYQRSDLLPSLRSKYIINYNILNAMSFQAMMTLHLSLLFYFIALKNHLTLRITMYYRGNIVETFLEAFFAVWNF